MGTVGASPGAVCPGVRDTSQHTRDTEGTGEICSSRNSELRGPLCQGNGLSSALSVGPPTERGCWARPSGGVSRGLPGAAAAGASLQA